MKRTAFLIVLFLTVVVCLHVALVKHPANYLTYITAAESILDRQNPYAPLESLDFFKYSPLAGLMIIPFSLLIDEVGTFLFVFFQYWLFFWGFWRWAKTAGFRIDQSKSVMIVAFCSVITDATLSVQICQVNAAIFGLMLLAAAQYSGGKHLKSGLLLSMATNLKLFPFTLGLCLLSDFKKKFWASYLSGLVFWSLLPVMFLGFSYNLQLLREWFFLMDWDQTRNLEMLDIGNFLELHFGVSQSLRNPLAVGVGLLIGWGALCLFKRNRHDLINRYLLPVNALYILFFSYLSESATSILATPSIFLIGMEAIRAKTKAWIFWIAWVVSLLLVPTFYSDIVPRAWLLWARGFHLKTVGYLFLSIVIGWLICRDWKQGSSR
ncbi:glycosyltransferase family 87 protein [Acidobacteriota bacterium]